MNERIGRVMPAIAAIILVTIIGLSVTCLLAIAGGYEHVMQVAR